MVILNPKLGALVHIKSKFNHNNEQKHNMLQFRYPCHSKILTVADFNFIFQMYLAKSNMFGSINFINMKMNLNLCSKCFVS